MKRKSVTLLSVVFGMLSFLSLQVFQATPAHADGCYTWNQTLREGSSGEGVTRLQIRIAGWMTSGSILTVDGQFGPGTTAALKRFQAGYGLPADGVAGPATFNKIYELQDDDCTPVHFSYAEASNNCNKGPNGFVNGTATPAEIKENLLRALWKAEAMRHKLGDVSLNISSGFRDKPCNRSVGGATNSRHMSGEALDFTGSPSLCTIAKAARTSGFATILGPGYVGHGDHTHVESRTGSLFWRASRCGI